MRHVIFMVGRDRYALPLDAVKEIVDAPAKYVSVPRSGQALKGVINVRGRVVPIADLKWIFSGRPTEEIAGAKVVLLELKRRELGVLSDAIEGIESIERVNPIASGAPLGVKGSARLGAVPVAVLDVEQLETVIAQSVAPRAISPSVP
jgi:purine-binding chemotaxis protein CheW